MSQNSKIEWTDAHGMRSQTYTLEFPTVAPQTFWKLKHELAKQSRVENKPDGTVSIQGAGIDAIANFDPVKNILTVDILDRGVWPVAMIKSQIAAALLIAAQG
jgi:hypothetical protein